MKLLIPKEISPETRVALIPQMAKKLIETTKLEIFFQAEAGVNAGFPDQSYLDAGTKLSSFLAEANVFLCVAPPSTADLQRFPNGSTVVGFFNALSNPGIAADLAKKNITAFAMEMIPRISRAQSMDALSSQAALAGYKAVLLAANHLQKIFPLMTTAAGTLTPAKVLILGVGVAGLSAIATAKRLGAVVSAFDIRPETKEQVESLGAKFIDITLPEQVESKGGYAQEVSQQTTEHIQKVLSEAVAKADIIITTAQVPGKKAPRLIDENMLTNVQMGAVIVDLASHQGGNVAGSRPNEEVKINGATILGPTNLPAMLAHHASQMLARNFSEFLQLLFQDGKLHLNFEDEIINASCLTHEGEIKNKTIAELLKKESL